MSIEEKRVYDEKRGATAVFVATGTGLARVEVSDDLVGRFGLVERCAARDVAAVGDGVAVATDEDVLVGRETLSEAGFGPATAVGVADGDLVAAGERGVARAGLDDARDVTAAGVPLAATADGLYRLGNGWMDELDGAFRTVASDGRRAHAATADALYARAPGETDWTPGEVPADGTVVDVGYGERVYAVTGDGTFLVAAEDGWRTRSLGLPEVAALAVV
ncbi:hypothetical protein BRC94_02090 [Halobacteriales archaeon QS_5_70_17]|nr:MAG: hypothetical protein BRC94_02090 [Halobacteriales archaeon QS_5_70_17]